jgi:hypothetical protein
MDRFNGLDVPESLEDALDPATLALIVYDMQSGILAQIADGDRVLANVLKVLAAARKRGIRTIFTRHYFMPTELAGVYQLRQAKIWQRKNRAAETRPLIPHGSAGFQLVEELQPRPGEAVIDKITMSAFEGTPLNIVLRDWRARLSDCRSGHRGWPRTDRAAFRRPRLHSHRRARRVRRRESICRGMGHEQHRLRRRRVRCRHRRRLRDPQFAQLTALLASRTGRTACNREGTRFGMLPRADSSPLLASDG